MSAIENMTTSNRWVLLAIVATIGLQVAALHLRVLQRALHTVPLRDSDWWLILAVAIPIFIVRELIKYLRGGHRVAATTSIDTAATAAHGDG